MVGRSGSVIQHDVERGCLRRRRRRYVRYFDLHRSVGVHRGLNGRPNAGISRQEDRSLRREDGHAGGSCLPTCNPGICGNLRNRGVWYLQHPQSWAPRPERDYLRIHVAGRQQWFGVCGIDYEHDLVQHHGSANHAGGPLLHDYSDARDCRKPGAEKVRPAIAWHFSGNHASLHRALAWRGPDCGRAHLFPCPEPRPNLRASADGGRKNLLRTFMATTLEKPVLQPNVAQTGPSNRGPRKKAVWEWKIVRRAAWDSVLKLNPQTMMGNPVMFVVEIGSVITTVLLFKGGEAFKFNLQITLWLWFTVLFANFAEAMAEGRGKAQADTLRRARSETMANRLLPGSSGQTERVASGKLRTGDLVLVSAGEFIPSDGEILEGVASVDESAITGESAPVIREAGGDRSAVTGGTRVLSDQIKVKITSNPGETFLDRMIALVFCFIKQKTAYEIALNILLAGLTIIFLLSVVTLQPFAIYSGSPQTVFVLVSLLVCLIPTTIGGLLSAIGIAGMDRLIQHNVLAMSGRAVEAAGDVNTLLLDKTGTITFGNRQASRFIPAPGVTEAELADAAQLSSLADETPEGRSIIVLAKTKYGLRGRELAAA